jgi:hypothetical protein
MKGLQSKQAFLLHVEVWFIPGGSGQTISRFRCHIRKAKIYPYQQLSKLLNSPLCFHLFDEWVYLDTMNFLAKGESWSTDFISNPLLKFVDCSSYFTLIKLILDIWPPICNSTCLKIQIHGLYLAINVFTLPLGKVGHPNSVTYLNWINVFQWFVVRSCSKNNPPPW